MTPHLADVAEFHRVFEVVTPARPEAAGLLPFSVRHKLKAASALCWELAAEAQSPVAKHFGHVLEELVEFYDAYEAGDFVGQLDALVDAEYCLLSLVLRLGFASPAIEGCTDCHSRLDTAWARVHAANLAKAEGGVRRSAAGKILKPPGWVAPDLSDLVL